MNHPAEKHDNLYSDEVESTAFPGNPLAPSPRSRLRRLGDLAHDLASSVSGRHSSRSPSPLPSPSANDKPPPYNLNPSSQYPHAAIEERLRQILHNYDTVIIVDDSGSMKLATAPSNGIMTSRWEEARTAIAGIAEKANMYDADGIDLYFLNHTWNSGKHMKVCLIIASLWFFKRLIYFW